MLKLRRRRGAPTTIESGVDALTVRNLLDDPGLSAVMGEIGEVLAEPIPLDWGRTEFVSRPSFGRRLLQRAA